MISVIITDYQRPEKLAKAIQSVKDQTYTDWEAIVVHDEPGTNSVDGNVTHYWREHTGLHAIQKNFGVKQAKGEYLAFLDSDNTWRPDHLQALYNAIQRDPTLDLVYGDRWLHDEGGNIPDQIGIYGDYNPRLLLEHNYIDTSDFLVKKQTLFDIGGWDERYKRMADWNLVVRLAKSGAKMLHVPLIITDYNLCTDSISHKPENDKQVIGWNPYELEIDLPYLHEVKDPTVAVMSVCYKDEELPIMQKCFPALRNRSGYPFYHVVVINGVCPKIREWLKEFKPDHVIDNNEGLGLHHACNQAVDFLKDKNFDIIWKVDPDMLVETDDVLKVMVDLYRKNHMMIWSAYPEGLIGNPGGAPRIGYGTLGGHLVGMTSHVGGFCQFMPAKARIANRLPEPAPLHGMEDIYLSQQVAKMGYGIGYIEDIRVRHLLKV